MRFKKVVLPGCSRTQVSRQLRSVPRTPAYIYRLERGAANVVLGRGRDRQHRRIEDEDGVPRVSMDYMFLTEHGIFGTIDEAEASMQADSDAQRHCLTVMVLKDFRYKSIWAYPVEGKGVSAAEWLITQILEDLDTCGLDQCRLVLKSDQEPGIIEVQQAIKAARGRAHDHGTAIENSKVGDSNSNARVERAIQEIGG